MAWTGVCFESELQAAGHSVNAHISHTHGCLYFPPPPKKKKESHTQKHSQKAHKKHAKPKSCLFPPPPQKKKTKQHIQETQKQTVVSCWFPFQPTKRRYLQKTTHPQSTTGKPSSLSPHTHFFKSCTGSNSKQAQGVCPSTSPELWKVTSGTNPCHCPMRVDPTFWFFLFPCWSMFESVARVGPPIDSNMLKPLVMLILPL